MKKITKDLLQDIKEKYPHLELIETTDQRNGYPSCLRYAIIGFENWSELEKIQIEFGIDDEYPKIFTQKAGWNLWYRTNNTAFKPFENDDDIQSTYGDNYNIFDRDFAWQYIIDTIDCDMNNRYDTKNIKSVEDVKQLIKDNEDSDDEDVLEDVEKMKELLDNFDELCREEDMAGEDSFILTDCGHYYDTILKKSMDFNFDTEYKSIGIGEDE